MTSAGTLHRAEVSDSKLFDSENISSISKLKHSRQRRFELAL
jgi:hypothetical protein